MKLCYVVCATCVLEGYLQVLYILRVGLHSKIPSRLQFMGYILDYITTNIYEEIFLLRFNIKLELYNLTK